MIYSRYSQLSLSYIALLFQCQPDIKSQSKQCFALLSASVSLIYIYPYILMVGLKNIKANLLVNHIYTYCVLHMRSLQPRFSFGHYVFLKHDLEKSQLHRSKWVGEPGL